MPLKFIEKKFEILAIVPRTLVLILFSIDHCRNFISRFFNCGKLQYSHVINLHCQSPQRDVSMYKTTYFYDTHDDEERESKDPYNN